MEIKVEDNSNEISVLKKCSFCNTIFSVKNNEDLNDHISNCTKYQDLVSKEKDKQFCPICQKKTRNSTMMDLN